MPKDVTVRLTKKELWELINNYGQSFESGAVGNEVADKVMDKLNAAYERFK